MTGLSARQAAARRRGADPTRTDPTRADTNLAGVRAVPACTDLFAPALTGLLDCCETALDDCDRPVARAFLAPGTQVAWDACCDGQLWVRIINAFPSGRPFPSPDTAQPCGITILAARLGVGVVRCAATVDDNGNAPDPAELTADTLDTTLDASVLLSAIQCCDLPGLSAQATRVVAWTPSGPQGGCVGGEWEIVVGFDNCGC